MVGSSRASLGDVDCDGVASGCFGEGGNLLGNLCDLPLEVSLFDRLHGFGGTYGGLAVEI